MANNQPLAQLWQGNERWIVPEEEFGKEFALLNKGEEVWDEFWASRPVASTGLALTLGEVPEYGWYTPCEGDIPQVYPRHPEHKRVP